MLAGATPVLVHNCDIGDGYLYRGLAKGRHSYAAAAEGRAVPRGGHSDIMDHVARDNMDSVFTSWTHDIDTAAASAESLGRSWVGTGVMLRIRVANIDPPVGPSRNIQIHNSKWDASQFEEGHLIVGEMQAHEISFGFGGTWRSVAGDEVNKLSASELLTAFGADSEVNILAKNALISGAHFHVGIDPVPAERLLGICWGRVRTLQRRGKSTVGAAECLTNLAEMGERGLHVVYVDDRKRAGYYFKLYLDPHPLKVIGCFGVNISPEDEPTAGPV
ncbi:MULTISPECIES: hypothetical protein [Streptomyces]|uniref:hypothetical protein n=1 Tax=Streptomyces TaxID=1883 RepID=UPI001AE20084|nr:hypothetical protein [Streptomyces sp. KCTC 0041BP]MBP0932246.1 hypothetical protein [Streptomyces sp. KCTC 0041BP]